MCRNQHCHHNIWSFKAHWLNSVSWLCCMSYIYVCSSAGKTQLVFAVFRVSHACAGIHLCCLFGSDKGKSCGYTYVCMCHLSSFTCHSGPVSAAEDVSEKIWVLVIALLQDKEVNRICMDPRLQERAPVTVFNASISALFLFAWTLESTNFVKV